MLSIADSRRTECVFGVYRKSLWRTRIFTLYRNLPAAIYTPPAEVSDDFFPDIKTRLMLYAGQSCV